MECERTPTKTKKQNNDDVIRKFLFNFIRQTENMEGKKERMKKLNETTN